MKANFNGTTNYAREMLRFAPMDIGLLVGAKKRTKIVATGYGVSGSKYISKNVCSWDSDPHPTTGRAHSALLYRQLGLGAVSRQEGERRGRDKALPHPP